VLGSNVGQKQPVTLLCCRRIGGTQVSCLVPGLSPLEEATRPLLGAERSQGGGDKRVALAIEGLRIDSHEGT